MPTTHPDREQRTEPHLRDSESRFQSMVDGSKTRAYSMALQLTRNRSDAEDLYQDTLVKAWKGFESYLPGRPFLNWLLRIMQRAYLDTRRRENPIRKADRLSDMLSGHDGETHELAIPADGPLPDDLAIQEEFRRELQSALAEIPEVYRTAIVLCDLEELSYFEIAQAQHTTVGTVRSRIHRGRKLLREILQRKGVGFPRQG
ncbi:MAG: sigma-70 family RNA polymerase sigma factor [Fimbriimonas ginsengisoli]|nr:sigma-70 family RNA polymerase sigma factor [Fimbriimonas ginsengisoli]